MRTPRIIPKLLRARWQFRRAWAIAKYGKNSLEYAAGLKNNFMKDRVMGAMAPKSTLQNLVEDFKAKLKGE